ncbi:nucleotide disphospho-sugar-binding domain-containing protein [Streptomyces sp. NPDC048018]|uniref:nucleotide disphospho-sugar-binding domain-containing protein n=1 Tax=Streptomyces sp. NPDC048018 TaxID=3365499 RepID=UPI003712D833
MAAVVHRSGPGTTTTAARAGAPQVVLAQTADQAYGAGRVAEPGIGAGPRGPVRLGYQVPGKKFGGRVTRPRRAVSVHRDRHRDGNRPKRSPRCPPPPSS